MQRIISVEISNLFGIQELKLDEKSILASGTNGVGKTSILDAVKLALTNRSDKEIIVRDGAVEGEILVKTDQGLSINRKKRIDKSDYVKVTMNDKAVQRPESYLGELFTLLQLNPIEFISKSEDEQNRMILDLIKFPWDTNWIKEQFGEIPQGIDYAQNLLKVLNDIQAINSPYYLQREDLNRRIRNDKDHVKEINDTLPMDYEPNEWKNYSLSETYEKIKEIKTHNSLIETAKSQFEITKSKLESIDSQENNEILEMQAKSDEYKNNLESEITQFENEIKLLNQKIASNKEKLSKISDQKSLRTQEITEKYSENRKFLQEQLVILEEKTKVLPIDATQLEDEAKHAEEMKGHLNEFNRMVEYQVRIKDLTAKSEELTRKIELARKLPSIILKNCELPVDKLSIENGRPMVNGRPLSNLSEGEKLELCIDITIANKDKNNIGVILVDGIEKLSEINSQKIFDKCKTAGLQIIATRTTNSNILNISEL